MQANEYHQLARRTANGETLMNLQTRDAKIIFAALRMATDTARPVDKLKKLYFHGDKRYDRDTVALEAPALESYTLTYPPVNTTPSETLLLNAAFGLVGEVGEFAELVTDDVFCGNVSLNTDEFVNELGDILWYAAAACSALGVDMEEVMQANIAKLKKRYPDGFSTVASQTRVDVGDKTNA